MSDWCLEKDWDLEKDIMSSYIAFILYFVQTVLTIPISSFLTTQQDKDLYEGLTSYLDL